MDKRGLGKGLGALFPGASLVEEQGAVREVPVGQIRPNPYQPREQFDRDKLEELAQSVREHGILQPVLLRNVGPNAFELIAGERRFRAAQAAGLERVPAVVKELADPQMLEVALIENVQREDIGPLEAARAYQRLNREFGLTQEAIARRVGKSQPTIANALRLLLLPEPVQDSLARGEITEGHARAILQAPADRQVEVLQAIRGRGLTVRDAERVARDLRNPRRERERERAERQPAPEPRDGWHRDANLAAVEEALQVALGTKVSVRKSGSGGRIEIEFYSDDELEGIVERLLGPSSPE